MLYNVYLTATAASLGAHVADHLVVNADNRDEAIGQRPSHWPLRRTRASRVRYG